jgi:hypothetical protein
MPRAPVFYEARKSARGDRATLADARRPHPLRAQHPVPRWHHRQFEPLNFPARLASLVPSPRVNLTRFHGVFAANHRLRAQIVPGKRGRGCRHRGPPSTSGSLCAK